MTYSGRSTNWPVLWLGVALTVPLLVLGRVGGGDGGGLAVPLAIAVAANLANLLTASSLRTVAGRNGVAVHFGAFGWPRARYALDRIARAEAVAIPPTWLAWGIHWTRAGGLMLTLRGGPALRLTLTSGRRITISTPDPVAAAEAIEGARPVHR